MTTRRHLLLATALLPLAAPALAQDTVTELGPLRIVNPWTRAAGQGMQGGGFLVIRNTSATADRLVSASSPAAGRMELHTHIRDGDVMRMRPVNDIPVPANGEVTLQPGGLHLMLMQGKGALKEGQVLPLRLQLEGGSEASATLTVRKAAP